MGCCVLEKISEETRQKNSFIYCRDNQFRAYAEVATFNNDFEQFEELFQKGFVNFKFPSFQNRTLLHFAALYGKYHLVERLLQEKADVNALDKNQIPPVFVAFESGNFDIVRLLSKYGAELYFITKFGQTFDDYKPVVTESNRREIMKLYKEINYYVNK